MDLRFIRALGAGPQATRFLSRFIVCLYDFSCIESFAVQGFHTGLQYGAAYAF
jgi:hypothetical protein